LHCTRVWHQTCLARRSRGVAISTVTTSCGARRGNILVLSMVRLSFSSQRGSCELRAAAVGAHGARPVSVRVADSRHFVDRGQTGPLTNMVCATSAGVVTCFATNPIWLLKTRLQLQVSNPPNPSNPPLVANPAARGRRFRMLPGQPRSMRRREKSRLESLSFVDSSRASRSRETAALWIEMPPGRLARHRGTEECLTRSPRS